MNWKAWGVVFAILGLGVWAAHAAGRWDGAFQKRQTVTMDGGQNYLAVPAGAYVKVDCSQDAHVGNAVVDGGGFCNTTLCDLTKFSLGEKYYSQLTPQQNGVSILSPDGGSAAGTCWVGVSVN